MVSTRQQFRSLKQCISSQELENQTLGEMVFFGSLYAIGMYIYDDLTVIDQVGLENAAGPLQENAEILNHKIAWFFTLSTIMTISNVLGGVGDISKKDSYIQKNRPVGVACLLYSYYLRWYVMKEAISGCLEKTSGFLDVFSPLIGVGNLCGGLAFSFRLILSKTTCYSHAKTDLVQVDRPEPTMATSLSSNRAPQQSICMEKEDTATRAKKKGGEEESSLEGMMALV